MVLIVGPLCTATRRVFRSSRSRSKSGGSILKLGLFKFKLWLILSTCLAGCSSGAPDSGRDVVLDFVEHLPFAEVNQEVKRIAFGTPEARSHFVSGWSRDSKPEGERYVWSTGKKPELSFWLRAARDLPVRLRGAPFGPGRQRVSIEVNGNHVAKIAMKSRMADYNIVLPKKAVHSGGNLLTFHFAHASSPVVVAPVSHDRRVFSARWTDLEFLNAPSNSVRSARKRLHLPAGSRLDYYMMLQPASYVEVSGLRRRGDARVHLEVTIESESLDEPIKRELSPSEGGGVIQVPVSTPQKGRISFRAVAPPDDELKPGAIVVEDLNLTTDSPVADTPAPQPSDKVMKRPGFNVVVYLIDALRADRLGCYGYERPTSPNIDFFAEEAAVFEHTIAQAAYTRASVPSLLTGTGPRIHGVLTGRSRMRDRIEHLVQLLTRQGYDTRAVLATPILNTSGVDRGFGQYSVETTDQVLNKAIQWIDERENNSPFYLYIHTDEPHAPYRSPDKFRAKLASNVREPAMPPDRLAMLQRIHNKLFGEKTALRISLGERVWLEALSAGVLDVGDLPDRLSTLYDAEVAHADERFGKLVTALKKRSLFDKTVIVLTSDHGEEFYEHGGWEHERTLYWESVNIPLVIRFPSSMGIAGRRIEAYVQGIDVAPTVLATLGAPIPGFMEGDNLLPLLRGEEFDEKRRLFSHNGNVWVGDSVIDYPWKYFESQKGRELFHLERDPKEKTSLTSEYPLLAGYYRSLIRARARMTSGGDSAPKVDISPEQLKKLRTLGYME